MRINEIFGPTIQGEGKSAGKEVMFVRLAQCNLHCIWCDTPYTWNWLGTPFAHPDKFDKEKEIHEMCSDHIFRVLIGLSPLQAVVISGGEPLLQQKELVVLLRMLRRANYWIELETNGTIEPTSEVMSLVNQFNCSPKLANSQDPLRLRERPNVLETLSGSERTTFKFVVSSENDIDEILGYVLRYNMQDVYLMPEGRTREELEKHTELTKKLCSANSFKFTQRLHIIKFGTKRAV